MKTDVIVVSSSGSRMETALKQVEKVAVYQELSPRAALQLRLLTEEMMGLMRGITGETEGEFWIENQEDNYQLHLVTETRLTSEKRAMLLSASTSGKNESARTLMGWLRDVFDRSTDEDVAMYANPTAVPGMEYTAAPLDWEWSMQRYQQELTEAKGTDAAAQEAWDQLEQSVVAHVADDVKVSIRGLRAELIILKKLK